MNRHEIITSDSGSRKMPVDRIDDLKKDLAANSLEENLELIVKFFFDNQIDDEDIQLFQSKVAFLFESVMEIWQKNGKRISELRKEIDVFFESRKDLPNFFLHVRPMRSGKRQPNIIESIQETLKRFEILERLEPVFEKSCEGIIVGGSLSYGAFYNVRAKKDGDKGSDIDAILVLDKNSAADVWKDFLESQDFSKSDKQMFMDRKKIFLESFLPKGEASVMSQKFCLEKSKYEISMHFFTKEALNKMLISNIKKEVEKDDEIVIIKGYKLQPFPHNVCPQNNFDGEPYNYIVPEQKVAEKGIIAELPMYIISGHKFYPGIYQNLILPMYSIFYDRSGEITEKMSAFKESIRGYVKSICREENTDEIILKSHMRNSVFPQTLKEEIRS